jgi:hypothetical protein
LTILSGNSWEEKVENGGVQLDWGACWDNIVIGPDTEIIKLEEA